MDSTRDAVRVENIQYVIIPDSPLAYESGLSGKWEAPFPKLLLKKFLHIRFGKFKMC